MRILPTASLGGLLLLMLTPCLLEGQMRDRIRDRARQQVERRVERRAEQAVEKALDKTESAIKCVVTDTACIEQAKQEGREVELTDAAGNPVASGNTPAAGAVQRVGEGAWANYDFVPGDRVLFAEDFANDRVGNFPRRLEFIKGAMEIVEWRDGRYLRSTADGSFDVVLAEALPDRFTVEFDLYSPNFWATEVSVVDPNRKDGELPRAYFSFNGSSGFGLGSRNAMKVVTSIKVAPTTDMMRVSMIADGPYVKIFLDETRIANVPNANFPRTGRIRFMVHGTSEYPGMIGNIRVAAGSTSLYDALMDRGEVATQGILFDTGSDRIRPESTPTLKEIGEMLQRHAELRLRIEGHTDNVGNAQSNQQLSERRAAAVRQFLLSTYGISANRLESVGKGQAEPAVSNDTPEGRQQNRRVVLVRL
jgi:OmpA-OmpF porin, OOP family